MCQVLAAEFGEMRGKIALMLTTYEAILRGNIIEWRDDAPRSLPPGRAMHVHVTVLDEPVAEPSQGERMAAMLEAIAASKSLEGVDAALWEREQRAERSLPGRSE